MELAHPSSRRQVGGMPAARNPTSGHQHPAAASKVVVRLDRVAGLLAGHAPATQLMCVSYGQELSDKLARDCRTIMTTRWYQSLFATRLSAQKQAVQEFV